MTLRAVIIIALSVLASGCGKATSLEEHEARQADLTAPDGAKSTAGTAPHDE